MSEQILKALMQLFAIVARPESNTEDRRTVVESVLRRQLNQELVDEYLSVFDGLKVLAKKEVAKEASNENYSDTGLNENVDSYKNVKLLDIIGLGIVKLSKNKIKLNDKRNDEEPVTANRLSVGKSKKENSK